MNDWYEDTRHNSREQAELAFDLSDNYLAAYADYCDGFQFSKAYDDAVDQWLADFDNEVDYPTLNEEDDLPNTSYYDEEA